MSEQRGRGERMERERLRKIHRVWQRWTRRIPVRSTWWAEADTTTSTYRVAVASSLGWLAMDQVLWSTGWFPLTALSLPPSLPVPQAAIFCGLGLWLANAILLHGCLTKTLPAPLPPRGWLMSLRFALSGIPLFGLSVFPLWSWLLRRRPAWAFRDWKESVASLVPKERLPFSTVGSSARWIESPGPMIWLLVINLLAFWIGSEWLHQLAIADPMVQRGLLPISLVVHALLAAAITLCVRDYLRQPSLPASRRRVAPVIPLFFLLPVPYLFLFGFLLLDFLRPETRSSTTLVHQVLLRRRQTARLPLWLYLEDAVQPKVARDLPEPSPELIREQGLLRLYDLKTLTLGLDAAVLGWVILRLATGWTEVESTTAKVLEMIVLATGVVGCLAALVAAAHYVSALLRLPGPLRFFDRHPYASYTARTQLALSLGLDTGRGLAAGSYEPDYLSLLLVLLVSLFGFRLIASGLIARTPLAWRRLPDLALLLLPVLALAVMVRSIGQRDPATVLDQLALSWMVASLLLGGVLALTLLPWLTRPHRPEQLFTPGVPALLRLRLASLVLPTVLPLGGALVPLWIHLRGRS